MAKKLAKIHIGEVETSKVRIPTEVAYIPRGSHPGPMQSVKICEICLLRKGDNS
jgi:hypothetical protein